MEIALSFIHVLPEALLLELSIVRGGGEQVLRSFRHLCLVYLAALVAEGGLGSLSHYLGTGEELGW